MKFKNLREKYKSKFPSSLVAAAVKIALDMGGNMTGAHKKIEAMKRGLANDPMVKNALRQANESVSEEVETVLEKAYDSNDVKKVQQLEKKLQGMLKEVEKTMKGSGLSAPAFNNVRSGISKGLESIQKFYKVANKVESVQEGLKKSGKGTIDVDYIGGSDLTKKLEKKFKVKIKQTGRTTADISGDYKNIIKLLKSDAYLMDEDEIEDTFLELVDEGTIIEANLNQLKRKHKRHIDAAKKGKDLPKKVEDELLSWAMDNGEIKTDDADESDEWLMNNVLESAILEGKEENEVSQAIKLAAQGESGKDKKDFLEIAKMIKASKYESARAYIAKLDTVILEDIVDIIMQYDKVFKKMYPKVRPGSFMARFAREEVVNEAMSDKDKKKRLALIKKAVEKINKKNADMAKKDALKMMKDSGMFEGVYTRNDGGAFDGLRIAKYLAHEDGKSWRKLGYGDTEGYLQDAAALLKKDKSKAREILSQPTPRD